LPLLASLEEKSTCGELDSFLRAGNNSLDRDDLADEAIKNVFALFWGTVALLVEEALPCF